MTNYERKWKLLKEWLSKEHNSDSNVKSILEIMTKLEKEDKL